MNNRQSDITFLKQVTKTISFKYLLYLPKNYETKEKWPLIIFLHGMGERGKNLDRIKRHGLPKLIEQGHDFPFIIISPQCPRMSYWSMQLDNLKELIDDIKEQYPIDTKRIYLTGMSMGGYGVWDLAIKNPKTFAAIAPICGAASMLGEIIFLKNIPIWAFHGAEDKVVPLAAGQQTVDLLKPINNNITFTIYPGVEHNSWDLTYENKELYKWFLEHKTE